jgi:transcriptional regulator with XRE-family HTH domain
MSDVQFTKQQLAAIGKRLRYGREHAKLSIAKAAQKADLPPNDYRKAEAGKITMPPRSLWLFSTCVHGTVEWLLTGKETKHAVPSPLPELPLDLSGFAARIKQTRERLGISIADIAFAGRNCDIPPLHWEDFEAGKDEPQYGYIEDIGNFMEVDLAWLYTDTPSAGKPKAAGGKLPTSDERIWMPGSSHGEGQRLRQSRESAKLSIDDVAKITGFDKPHLKTLEAGDYAHLDDEGDPGIVLATLYNVPLDWLMYGRDAIIVLKRRLERFKMRLGIDPRKKSKAA